MKYSNQQLIGIGVVGLVGLWYLGNRATAAAKVVGQAIDPTSQDNIFYTGVNAVGEKLSGRSSWTLGGWIYDITHGE